MTTESKLYVGNLPLGIQREDLEAIFVDFGEISEAYIVRDRRTRRPKRFGFVVFESTDAAEAALSMDGYDFNGREIRVSIAQDTQSQTGSANGGARETAGTSGSSSRGSVAATQQPRSTAQSFGTLLLASFLAIATSFITSQWWWQQHALEQQTLLRGITQRQALLASAVNHLTQQIGAPSRARTTAQHTTKSRG